MRWKTIWKLIDGKVFCCCKSKDMSILVNEKKINILDAAFSENIWRIINTITVIWCEAMRVFLSVLLQMKLLQCPLKTKVTVAMYTSSKLRGSRSEYPTQSKLSVQKLIYNSIWKDKSLKYDFHWNEKTTVGTLLATTSRIVFSRSMLVFFFNQTLLLKSYWNFRVKGQWILSKYGHYVEFDCMFLNVNIIRHDV